MLTDIQIAEIAASFIQAARCGQLSEVLEESCRIIETEDSDVKEAMIVSDKLKELQDLLVWEEEKESIELYNQYLAYGLPD